MDTLLTVGIILLIGILFFIYFLTKRNYRLGQPKAEPIEHYEEKRDEVSDKEAEVEEPEPEEETKSDFDSGGLYRIVVTLVVLGLMLGVGVTILTSFSEAEETGTSSIAINSTITALTPIASTWMPLIVTVAVLAIILKLVIGSFGSTEEEKPKKRRKKRKMNTHIKHYSDKRDRYSDAEAGIKNQKEELEEEISEEDE